MKKVCCFVVLLAVSLTASIVWLNPESLSKLDPIKQTVSQHWQEVGQPVVATLVSNTVGESSPIADLLQTSETSSKPTPPTAQPWPPRWNETYPDLALYDQNGNLIQLSRLAGKPILVELVAIPCKGCQAFAGGNQYGGFDGVAPQKGLDSIHEYARQYGRVELGRDIAFVQIILYSNDLNAPTAQETKDWASHFGMEARKRQLVLQGTDQMLGDSTYELIPGFQLIDKDFVLRFDSSGHSPRHNLYTELLPAIRGMK